MAFPKSLVLCFFSGGVQSFTAGDANPPVFNSCNAWFFGARVAFTTSTYCNEPAGFFK